MLIRILLFALLASWIAACESSGDGTSADGNANNGGGDSINWGDWEIDNSLPELEGNLQYGDHSIVSNSGYKNYVLYPVMQTSRKIAQSVYDGDLLQKLSEVNDDKGLYATLFGDNDNGHVRYQKQMKCLADLHEIELEIQSLLVAASDPELREGVFKPDAINTMTANNSENGREEFLRMLWDEEHGTSDFGRLFHQYRLKIAAFLTLPFSNETDDVLSNAWSCTFTENIWEEQFGDLKFHEEVKTAVDGWLSEDSEVTQTNLPAELAALVELVEEFEVDDGRLSLGASNKALLGQALIITPDSGSDVDRAFERGKSYEGSLYSLAKLVCKNEFAEGHSESDLCGSDLNADKGYTKKAAFSNRYQLTRDLNEQVASNVGNLMERVAVLGTMSPQLITFSVEKFESNTRDFVKKLKDFESDYVDPLDERAESTKDVANSGCRGKYICGQTLLASYADAESEKPVKDWIPIINQVCKWDEEDGVGCPKGPIDPDLRLIGDDVFPYNEDNKDIYKNALRYDRVAHAMTALWGDKDSGIVEVLNESDELIDKLGSWNHLITLLLITFGALRLRSRRSAVRAQ